MRRHIGLGRIQSLDKDLSKMGQAHACQGYSFHDSVIVIPFASNFQSSRTNATSWIPDPRRTQSVNKWWHFNEVQSTDLDFYRRNVLYVEDKKKSAFQMSLKRDGTKNIKTNVVIQSRLIHSVVHLPQQSTLCLQDALHYMPQFGKESWR